MAAKPCYDAEQKSAKSSSPRTTMNLQSTNTIVKIRLWKQYDIVLKTYWVFFRFSSKAALNNQTSCIISYGFLGGPY